MLSSTFIFETTSRFVMISAICCSDGTHRLSLISFSLIILWISQISILNRFSLICLVDRTFCSVGLLSENVTIGTLFCRVQSQLTTNQDKWNYSKLLSKQELQPQAYLKLYVWSLMIPNREYNFLSHRPIKSSLSWSVWTFQAHNRSLNLEFEIPAECSSTISWDAPTCLH